jgi:hypothetical protein
VPSIDLLCVFDGKAFLAQVALDRSWIPLLDCPMTIAGSVVVVGS